MKWFLYFVLLFVAACSPCETTSDCDPGERCEFRSGDCVTDCENDDDCSARAVCDRTIGKCVPRTVFSSDAGTTTSTAGDAGT